MGDIDWYLRRFDALDLSELYRILQLRQEVFVVEQNCAFLDADGEDQQAWHLAGWQDRELVAYARIFAPGCVRDEASIGRVLSRRERRKEGLGIALMNQVIGHLPALVGDAPVWIGAQERLCRFYAGFGFRETGERYLEDGIWHRGMQATVSALRPLDG